MRTAGSTGRRLLLQRNDFNHEGTKDTKKYGEAEKEAITGEERNVDNSIFITSSCFFVIFVASWFIVIALSYYGGGKKYLDFPDSRG